MPGSPDPRPPLTAIAKRLRALTDPAIATHSARFFKAGPGEYGAGDRFLGIRVPALRAIAREFRDCPPVAAFELLGSPWHEERLLALLLLVGRFARAGERERGAIYRGYVAAIPTRINNWDLVDCSAPAIVGGHLERRNRRPLRTLARG